jgi:hypothetical protein
LVAFKESPNPGEPKIVFTLSFQTHLSLLAIEVFIEAVISPPNFFGAKTSLRVCDE